MSELALVERRRMKTMTGARARPLAEVVLVFLGILAAFSLESWRAAFAFDAHFADEGFELLG